MANHEKHIDDLLRDALGDYTEQPPAGAWADMEEKLDAGHSAVDLFFKEALGDYTEQPPIGAWPMMQAKLDDGNGMDVFFKDALSNYAEVPPSGAWADMETRLDKRSRRRRGIIWFWSAAALCGLLIMGYFLKDNVQHTVNRQAEINIETPVTAPVVKEAPVAPKTEEKTEASITTTKQNVPDQVAQTPKVNNTPAPVIEKVMPEQEAPVAEKKETPVQKAEPQPQPMPAVPEKVAAQNDSAIGTGRIKVDDIAAAISRRANGTVMIVKKSRYADSVAEAEKVAQQKAAEEKEEKEKTQQQEAPAIPQPPVIAAKADTIKDIVQQEVIVQPDTLNALAQEAISETQKAMEATQDAIVAAQLQEPLEQAVFEMSTLAAKAAETVTGGGDKGTLQAYISPEAVAKAYDNMMGNGGPEPLRVRMPLKLDWFVKAGYETGFEKQTAGKFVFAPAVQVGLTSKLSLMLQPAIKSGRVNYSQVSAEASYYNIESSYMDSVKTFTIGHNSQGYIFDSVRSKYFYQQTHDSLVVSNSLATRSIVEAELPVMLNYKVGKNFSVYGGPVVTYSSMLKINEKIEKHGSTTLRDTIVYGVSLANDAPPPPPISEVFQYNTPNISQYSNAQYTNSTVNKIRFGYMAGASYNYKRFTADVTVQQNLSRMNYITNPGVRNIYLQPYMRLMLGFKLNGNK